MINNLLEQIIDSGESVRAEFKAALPSTDTIGQVVCSFLNTRGGTLIIGVDDSGKVVGIDDALMKAEQIRQDLLNSISPQAAWSINVEQLKGKDVIVLDVPQGLERPYVYGNGIFVRRDTSTVPATNAEINSLIDKRYVEGSRWERMPALGFELEDLDIEEIRRAAREAQERRLYQFDNPDDPSSVLEQLSLSTKGLILNSAVILFGRNPARRFPQVRIRAARFKGIDPLSDFSDNRVFEGHAFKLRESLEQFLLAHIPIASELPRRGTQRTDTPVYPWPALREAMLNAIVHRDYAPFDGGMSVAIYDDRIEMWNSGSLPSGITVESLKGLHPSLPHNPDIAHVFFLRGHIERWGTGTQRIVNQCVELGLPEPEWSTGEDGVRLTIRLKHKYLRIELNSRQIKLLRRLKVGQRIHPSDYFTQVAEEAKERRARQDLLELFRAGYLSREGRGPSTYYIRTDKALT